MFIHETSWNKQIKKGNITLCSLYLNKNQYIIRFLTPNTVEGPSLLSRESKGNQNQAVRDTHPRYPPFSINKHCASLVASTCWLVKGKRPEWQEFAQAKRNYWDSDIYYLPGLWRGSFTLRKFPVWDGVMVLVSRKTLDVVEFNSW